MSDQLEGIVSAYDRLSNGEAAQLVELLDPEVVWSVKGSQPVVGRDLVAGRIAAAIGTQVELAGVRKGHGVVVIEFTRPWWRQANRGSGLMRSLFGIRGEQAVWVRDGRIARIESRERPHPTD